MKTLLQKALEYKKERKTKPVGIEERELAIAFIKGEITMSQASAAIDRTYNNTAYILLKGLKEAYFRQEIKTK